MNKENNTFNDQATRIDIDQYRDKNKTVVPNTTQKQNSIDVTVAMPFHDNEKTQVSNAETKLTNSLTGNLSKPTSKKVEVGSILKERYLLTGLLGSGGMGSVFKATDLLRQELNDPFPDVAVKVLNDDFKNNPELVIALQRETQKTQQLAHPNIITVYNFDIDQDTIFMVMEILEGQTLKTYLKNKAQFGLAFKQAWPIIKGVALALAYSHKRNIVHSDFKPGNIIIKENGDVKVLDFGIATVAVQAENHAKDNFNARNIGALTPAYASLEMWTNQAPSPSDDIYALACVSYELLTGKHPFDSLSAPEAKDKKLQPKAIAGLSKRQWSTLQHALAFTRAQRTATVSEFIKGMEPRSVLPMILAGSAITALTFAIGYSFYIDYSKDREARLFEANLSEKDKTVIADRLEFAQMQEEVGNLTAPPDGSAVWAYQEMLKINPYNKTAKAGLDKIADDIYIEAEALFQQKNESKTLEKIEEGLAAVPKHEGLLKLQNRIKHK